MRSAWRETTTTTTTPKLPNPLHTFFSCRYAYWTCHPCRVMHVCRIQNPFPYSINGIGSPNCAIEQANVLSIRNGLDNCNVLRQFSNAGLDLRASVAFFCCFFLLWRVLRSTVWMRTMVICPYDEYLCSCGSIGGCGRCCISFMLYCCLLSISSHYSFIFLADEMTG